MLYNTGVSTITNAQSNLMTVDPEKAAKVAAMLVNNYTSYVTPVREVIVNGLEAIDNVRDGKVTVSFSANNDKSLPSSIFSNHDNDESTDFVITVTDNGCGMSNDFVKNKFVHLTASSKDDTDNTIGGFGIGAKSVASISHHTVFRTVQDNNATVVVFGMSDKGATTSVSEPMEVNEPNGTTVSIHVNGEVYNNVKENIEKQFLSYLAADTPLEVHDEVTSFVVGDKSKNVIFTHTYKGTTVSISHEPSIRQIYFGGQKDSEMMHMRCMGMPYPLPDSMRDTTIATQSFYDSMEKHAYLLDGLLSSGVSLMIDVEPQHVSIDSSRERVADTQHLCSTIEEAVRSTMENYVVELVHTLKNASSYQEFCDVIDNSIITLRRYGGFNDVMSSVRGISTEYNNSDSTDEDILFIPVTDDSIAGRRFYLRKMNKDSVLHTFIGNNATSVKRVVENAQDAQEALGINTHGCDFYAVGYDDKIVVNDTQGSSEYDKILPDVFLSTFGKDAEINLVMELLSWSRGCKFINADKSYTQIRRSMMSRGNTLSRKSAQGKKREVFYYADNNSMVAVKEKDIDEVFAQWKNDGIDFLIVSAQSGKDARYVLHDDSFAKDCADLNKKITSIFGDNHRALFIMAHRSDSMNKNVRIAMDKMDNAGISLSPHQPYTDDSSNKIREISVNQMTHYISDSSTHNTGSLFFDTSHDTVYSSFYDTGYESWNTTGYSPKILNYMMSDGSTVQDNMISILCLDDSAYDKEKEFVSALRGNQNIPSEEFLSGDGITCALEGIASLMHSDNDYVSSLISDSADMSTVRENAKILYHVARIVTTNPINGKKGRELRGKEYVSEALNKIFSMTRELIENRNGMMYDFIMSLETGE